MEAVSLGDGGPACRSSLVKCLSSLLTVASRRLDRPRGRDGCSSPRCWLRGRGGLMHGLAPAPQAPGRVRRGGPASPRPTTRPSRARSSWPRSCSARSRWRASARSTFASVVAHHHDARRCSARRRCSRSRRSSCVSAARARPPYFATRRRCSGALAPWFIRFLRALRAASSRWLRLPVPPALLARAVCSSARSRCARLEVWGQRAGADHGHPGVDWEWRLVLGRARWRSCWPPARRWARARSAASSRPRCLVGASARVPDRPGRACDHAATASRASAYALVGMGSFLAATTHAPLMAILVAVRDDARRTASCCR